eukprot:jgi/Botrbrau1/8680/Bobra.0087s0033.1
MLALDLANPRPGRKCRMKLWSVIQTLTLMHHKKSFTFFQSICRSRKATCRSCTECVIGHSAGTKVSVPFAAQDDPVDPQYPWDPSDCYITCKLPTPPAANASVNIREIRLLDQEQLAEWLEAWSSLGAQGIHAYALIWESSHQPTFPIFHRLLTWTLYLPASQPQLTQTGIMGTHAAVLLHHMLQTQSASALICELNITTRIRTRVVFDTQWCRFVAQKIAYNDCIYKHRHVYEFVFLMDADEFMYFPSGQPRSLLRWLRQTVPPRSAGVTFAELPASVPCRIETLRPINSFRGAPNVTLTHTVYSAPQILRDRPAYIPVDCPGFGTCPQKMAVRPLAVQAMNIHNLQILQPGWEEPITLKKTTACYRHVRCTWPPGMQDE